MIGGFFQLEWRKPRPELISMYVPVLKPNSSPGPSWTGFCVRFTSHSDPRVVTTISRLGSRATSARPSGLRICCISVTYR